MTDKTSNYRLHYQQQQQTKANNMTTKQTAADYLAALCIAAALCVGALAYFDCLTK